MNNVIDTGLFFEMGEARIIKSDLSRDSTMDCTFSAWGNMFPVCSVCRGEHTVYLPFMKLIAVKIYNMTQFLQNPFPADIVLAESKQSCGKGKQQQDAQHRW